MVDATSLDAGIRPRDVPDGCPVAHGGDERKTAALAAQRVKPNYPQAKVVTDFKFARDILRNATMLQAGAEGMDLSNPDQVSFFFLDGEIHRQKRSKVSRYFQTKAIEQRYHPVMERVMDRLITELKRGGRKPLDIMSFQMAVEVAAEVVGLTQSDPDAMSKRIRMQFIAMSKRPSGALHARWIKAVQTFRVLRFFNADVKPAIRARKTEPRDDVISTLVKENYTERAILIECMTYATAGMLTTREFIVAATWYLFDRPEVRERFLNGDKSEQFAILYEVLRLEPVAGMIQRRATADWTGPNGEQVKAGEIYAIDIRAVNTDEKVVGPCPFSFDESRVKVMKGPPTWMSFAEGAHRCPGNQVAIEETRYFLDRLFRVPGIRLVTLPKVAWFDAVKGYELHGALVSCDPA
jgi:cytochrome P450